MNISHLCFKSKASWVMQKYYITNTRMMPMHALITIFFDLENNHSHVKGLLSIHISDLNCWMCQNHYIHVFDFLFFGLNLCWCPLVCFAFLPNTSWSLRGNLLKVLAALLSKVFPCIQLKVMFVSLNLLQKFFCNLYKTNSSSHLHFAKKWISQQDLW